MNKRAPIIYNLFPLLAGTFSNWKGHCKRASEMGFNWVFVNTIQRPGKSGSLYSIADYHDFNPRFIDQKSSKSPREQAKEAVRAAEEQGLRCMADLVINHCSVDSDLLETHPEWFSWDKNGRVVHPWANENGKRVVWKDLARFDHKGAADKEGLFTFCLEVATFLIDLGFRGLRCDAAYQVPKSLWKRLISEVKEKHPDVSFFAETLGCQPEETRRTASTGFDYIFNSAKWWDFKAHWLLKQYALTREICPSVAFPESHDTQRLCEELGGNVQGLKQRYLFTALFSSGVMMPVGFEFGFRKKLHVVKTGPEDWEQTDMDIMPFITKVNALKASHAVFQEEAPIEIEQSNSPHVLVMWKGSSSTQEESLLILNKSIENKQRFSAESFKDLVQAGAPLEDLSPEFPLSYIPTPFSYDLLPGQGKVFIANRDAVEDD